MTYLTTLLAEDPTARLAQLGFLMLGIFIVFLLFFALRDILLRTRSFAYQIVCILLVALLPGVGFLIYLLIRPARTLQERLTDTRVKKTAELLEQMFAVEEDVDEEETDEGGTEGTEGTDGTGVEDDEVLEELEELGIDEDDEPDTDEVLPK